MYIYEKENDLSFCVIANTLTPLITVWKEWYMMG